MPTTGTNQADYKFIIQYAAAAAGSNLMKSNGFRKLRKNQFDIMNGDMSFEEYAQSANQIFGSPKKAAGNVLTLQNEAEGAKVGVNPAYLPKYQLFESCREAFEIIDKVDLPTILQNNSSSTNIPNPTAAKPFHSRKISHGISRLQI